MIPILPLYEGKYDSELSYLSNRMEPFPALSANRKHTFQVLLYVSQYAINILFKISLSFKETTIFISIS